MNINLYDQDQEQLLKNGNIQQVIWMEELAELQQAISKSLRGKLDRYNLIEEVADVLICLTQLRIEYAIDDLELQAMIDYKHRRNVERQSQQKEHIYKDENLIEWGDGMKDLDTTLEAYDIHFDRNRDCEDCPYKYIDDCINEITYDLYKHAKRLKEENKKLKERNKRLGKLINETVNLCNDLINQIDQMDQSK